MVGGWGQICRNCSRQLVVESGTALWGLACARQDELAARKINKYDGGWVRPLQSLHMSNLMTS